CDEKPPIFVRYVHQKTNAVMIKLSAGGVYVTKQKELITTVLGSCVAVCLRNVRTGAGGINHYMLPGGYQTTELDDEDKKFRYGELAIPELITMVLADGGSHGDLEAKIFGGADVLNTGSRVGLNNISCAFEVLSRYGIHVSTSDTGSKHPRKIIYNPLSGAVQLKRLRSTYQGMIMARERRYLDALSNNTQSGEGV
ncbi:MAG: chemotaxis protein CheD, partial [Pseudomonadales bacterium]